MKDSSIFMFDSFCCNSTSHLFSSLDFYNTIVQCKLDAIQDMSGADTYLSHFVTHKSLMMQRPLLCQVSAQILTRRLLLLKISSILCIPLAILLPFSHPLTHQD